MPWPFWLSRTWPVTWYCSRFVDAAWIILKLNIRARNQNVSNGNFISLPRFCLFQFMNLGGV